MGFLSQLELLLWKNFILRKRQKLRCLVELIWPLFLFSILMWVRTRGLKLYRHECHYQQKAMPSAGVLPFIQSFICAFNNTCHRYVVNESASGIIHLDESLILRLVDEVELLGQNEIGDEEVNSIQKALDDVKDLATLITSATKQERRINGSLSLRNVVKDPKILKLKLTSNALNLTSDVVETLLNSDLLFQNIYLDELVKSNPRKLLCDPNFIMGMVSSVTYNETERALNELCSLSDVKLNKVVQEIWRELNSSAILDQMSLYLKHNLGRSLYWNDWLEMISLSRRIFQQINSLETYLDLVNEVTRVGDEYESIQMSVQERSDNATSGFESILRYLQLHLCGKNSTDFLDQLKAGGGQSTRFDEIRDQLKESAQQEAFLYINDTTATPECNDIFKQLESDVVTRYLWNMVKPFVRGKILYAPSVEPVDHVMKIVNDSFSSLVFLKNTAELFLDKYIPMLKQSASENEESFNIIKEYLETNEGKLLENFLPKSGKAFYSFTDLKNLAAWFLERNNITTQEEAFDSLGGALADIIKFLECFDLDKVVGYDTEEEAVTEGMNLIESNRLWAVISFLGVNNEVSNTSSVLPPKVTYKIRIDSSRVDSTKRVEDSITNPGSRRRPAIDLKYITFGFAYLQDMIDSAIISELSGEDRKIPQPGIFLQQFPYPCHIIDQFVLAISRTFPMFMTLSWVYTCAMIVKSIVREKERRLRETMKAMGLRSSALWLSWFIDSFVFMLLVIACLTAILTKGKVLQNSDPSVIFVFITLYAIATITQCFFMSVFFSRANLAAAAGGILFFVTYLPYSFMVQWEERMPTGAKIATSLFSNVAFGFGCSYFAHYEEMGVGIQWSNIDTSPLLGDHYSLIGCAGMFIVDSVLYSLLTWYIETVFPGQYGIPKPWYFPVMKSYWCGSTVGPMTDISHQAEKMVHHGNDFEKEPSHLQLGVSIKGLTKIYGHSSNKKVAVRDLSINFYQDQITSFLGHNGAGKTTTISILTGLFPPSAGTAHVYGLDIRTNMDSIRKSLGTCPQHNVLFDHLTVEEHLWFYARLRGRPREEIHAEMDEMILDLGLPHKRRELAKNLSGGMQRKLSIAVAFVGGSRTVVLDEPTSGVDPYSRRSIWELLIKYKKGRTVILTTHFMDEADLLGDRIAIISHGRLRCCGSSLFLKARFGKGYYLTVERKEASLLKPQVCDISREAASPDLEKEHSEQKAKGEGDVPSVDSEGATESNKACDTPDNSKETKGGETTMTENITLFIRKSVPDAQLLEEVGSELLYLLPSKPLEEMVDGHTNSRISAKAMESLFDQLDSEMTSLGVNSYGVSDTTLEEIFLKVTEEGDKLEDGAPPGVEANASGVAPKDQKWGYSRLRELLDLRRMLRKLCKKNSLSYENNLIRESAKKQIVIQYKGNHVTYQNIPSTENGIVNSMAIDPEKCEHEGRLSLSMEGNKTPGVVICSGLGKTTKAKSAEEYETLSSNRLLYQQFTALLAKRFSRTKRNPKALFFEIVLPAIFVCLALVFTVLQPGLRQEPPLPLSPWLYGPPNYVFFSDDNPTNTTEQLVEGLLGDTGLGARCVADEYGKRDPHCRGGVTSWHPKPVPDPGNYTASECSCSVGTQQCPAGAEGPYPPQATVSTGDYMQNLTGRNISDWIVKTNKDYFKMRYGGFTFGVLNDLTISGKLGMLFSDYFTNISSYSDFSNQVREALRKTDKRNNVKVWFNNKGWASSVSYMSAMSNIILRASVPYETSDQYGIQVINHPMNFTDVQMSQELFKQSGISLLHAISVIFALSFVPASFVVFLIEERSSKSKHLQLVSGVHPTVYWIASYAWDSMNYLVSATLCIFIFMAFDEQAYVSEENIKGLILLLVLYGWASIPLMYPASFLFSVPSSAFVALGCANLFIGIVTTVATFVLEIFDDEELQYIASIIREVFLIFPHFCLGQGLMKMATNHMAQQSLSSLGLELNINLLEWDFLGKNLFSMFVAGFVFFGLNLAVEYKVLLTCWSKLRMLFSGRQHLHAISDEEEDVAKERRRVLSRGADDDILRLENLTKVYPSGTRPAVDQLCIGVRWGECFGLLGLNGAGKTTTFKMLTGDTNPTSGDAYVCGRSILPSSKTGCGCGKGRRDGELVDVRRRQLGYCPQFDALDPLLTAREHLTLYSRLRGVPSKHVDSLVEEGLIRLGLSRYADRLAGTYSGGNKRKLSTAIALVGDPPLVFLDEPTSGMDVGARRFLWACILSVVRERSNNRGDGKGRSVVLTSHSMEECEALCSRLTIMVNGRFRCLGSVQHLKDKFGSGYTLIVHCPSDKRAESVAEQLTTRLPPGAVLREAHHNRLRFQLPKGTSPDPNAPSTDPSSNQGSSPTKLSSVFRAMEEAREEGLAEDYSIMQTTLEEVFIRFANEQKDANGVGEEEGDGKKPCQYGWMPGGACCYPHISSVLSRRHKASITGGTV